ncbi:SCF ubiquitin ligase complex subunit [Ascosphaera aggregata]|nr:SCF ubiquitin ligase complex subunit [Ascosphaera aggregata]
MNRSPVSQEPLVRDICSSSSREDTTSSASSKPDSPTDMVIFTNKEYSSHWRRSSHHHKQAYGIPAEDGEMGWSPMPTPPIQRIPPEILMLIYGKLSSTADLLSCMLVSRSWAMACVPILWHRPTCNTWRSLASVVASVNKEGSLFAYADLIRRLNLSALHESVSTGTLLPFLKCEKIERLTLTNCTSLSDQPVSDLVARNHLVDY